MELLFFWIFFFVIFWHRNFLFFLQYFACLICDSFPAFPFLFLLSIPDVVYASVWHWSRTLFSLKYELQNKKNCDCKKKEVIFIIRHLLLLQHCHKLIIIRNILNYMFGPTFHIIHITSTQFPIDIYAIKRWKHSK